MFARILSYFRRCVAARSAMRNKLKRGDLRKIKFFKTEKHDLLF